MILILLQIHFNMLGQGGEGGYYYKIETLRKLSPISQNPNFKN